MWSGPGPWALGLRVSLVPFSGHKERYLFVGVLKSVTCDQDCQTTQSQPAITRAS